MHVIQFCSVYHKLFILCSINNLWLYALQLLLCHWIGVHCSRASSQSTPIIIACRARPELSRYSMFCSLALEWLDKLTHQSKLKHAANWLLTQFLNLHLLLIFLLFCLSAEVFMTSSLHCLIYSPMNRNYYHLKITRHMRSLCEVFRGGVQIQ